MKTLYRSLAVALIILFLASVARFYHPGQGFTALLGLPAGADNLAPALRAIPHYESPEGVNYDGQFYVQRALDPLLRDPAIDRAMDLAPLRARRILFSWTAYLLGFGRPAWIIEVFALQNVVCWLLLALLLTRWLPLTSLRGFALWTACLFAHGMLWSVRVSLLDGPSLLLSACAIALAERGWTFASAIVVGLSGLARETNVLAALAQRVPSWRDWGGWLTLALAAVIVVLPLLIWQDYLYSIYRSTAIAGTGGLVMPFSGIEPVWIGVYRRAMRYGLFSMQGSWLIQIVGLIVQAVYLLLVVARGEYRTPWWRVAFAYVLLMTMMDPVLARPDTGALTRVLLPMTVGFNILLFREPRDLLFWPWFIGGNISLTLVYTILPLLKPWPLS
jgi:hypothetical protein